MGEGISPSPVAANYRGRARLSRVKPRRGRRSRPWTGWCTRDSPFERDSGLRRTHTKPGRAGFTIPPQSRRATQADSPVRAAQNIERRCAWCAIGRRPQEVTCAGLFRMFTEATVPSCSVCEEDTTSGVNTRVRVLADDLTSNPADLPRSRKQATPPETKMKPGPAGGRRGHHFRRSANDRCTLWQRLLQARWSG